MPERDALDLHPPASRRRGGRMLPITLLLVALAAGMGWWWFLQRTVAPPPSPPIPSAAPADVPEPAPASGSTAGAMPPETAASAPQHPLTALEPVDTPLPALADADKHVEQLLIGLLGRDKVFGFLQTEGFIRRVVATVDNLGRSGAAARLWPLNPTPGQFQVQEQGQVSTIAAANAARYGPVLSFAEAVPLEPAVRLYTRLYPLFQQAYEELGYPGRHFNDRLVNVLDHLLRTPEPQGPLQLTLLEVRGEMADPRPWVRYEYTDATLQSLSSGQKILLRIGPENRRRAKLLIMRLRGLVATGAIPAQGAATTTSSPGAPR